MPLHVSVALPASRKLRLLLGLSTLASLFTQASRAAEPCFAIPVPSNSKSCLSWSRDAVVDGSPATLTGVAYAIRVTGTVPAAGTVFDRTVDTRTSEDPSIEAAFMNARQAIAETSPRPVAVSEPRLVESSTTQVAGVPLAILTPTVTVAVSSYSYPRRYATFCVGDLGQRPAPVGLEDLSSGGRCSGSASAVAVGYWWPLYSPPWYSLFLGQLDDTHLHTRTDTHRTVLFTGTLILRRYELVGEDPPGGAAGSRETGELP